MMATSARPLVAAVVAVSRNSVIGRDGTLPWRMSSDLKWFKTITMGKPVVMGRTTWEDLGRALPGRDNIVVSRQELDLPDGVHLAASIPDALSIGAQRADASGAEEVCIIGGAQIYAGAMAETDIVYITRIEAEIEGDTVLNLPGPDGWTVEVLDRIAADKKNEYDATIEKWTRAPGGPST